MTRHMYHFSSLPMVLLLGVVIGFSSCKSQKKITEISEPEEVSQSEETAMEEPEVESTPAATNNTTPKTATREDQVHNYFGAIASASSVNAANANIREALSMFSSPDAPLLIVIYRAGANPDYDEPTTIGKYLDYLKDTKNNNARVEELVYDTNGKIKEVVLKKTF